MNILVSIIVPFYNAEKYFKRCLESLETQLSDKRVELIFIDDGSTDQSCKIAEVFQKKHSGQVTVLTQKNSGSGVARNAGIAQAKGIFLGFVDSDDWIDPSMFTQMLDTTLAKDADIVICDFFKVYDNGYKREVKYLSTDISGIVPIEKKSFIFECGFSPWNKLIKKELFLEYKLYFAEGILHQDVAVLPAVLAKTNKIINVSKPLYYHYVRKGSSVRTWNSNVYDIFKALEYLKARLSSHYTEELEYLTIRELFHHVLPAQFRFNKEYEKFREFAVSYFLKNYPFWTNNRYVRNSSLADRLYLKMLLKSFSWPIALIALLKWCKVRLKI